MLLFPLHKRLSKKPFRARKKRRLHQTQRRQSAGNTFAAPLLEQEGPLVEPMFADQQDVIPLVNDEEQHLEIEKNESTVPSRFL